MAKCINYFEGIVTFEMNDAYEWEQYEKANIESMKKTYLDEIRALYWVLLHFIIDNRIQYQLPGNYFKIGEDTRLALKKLHYLVRYQVGFIEEAWDKDGNQIIVAKSTSNKSINQKVFSDLFANTLMFLSVYMTIKQTDEFNQQYQQAREANGKYY